MAHDRTAHIYRPYARAQTENEFQNFWVLRNIMCELSCSSAHIESSPIAAACGGATRDIGLPSVAR